MKDLASPELRAEKRPTQEGNDEEQADSKSVYKTVHLVDKVLFYFNCPPLFRNKSLGTIRASVPSNFYLILDRGGGLVKHAL